MTAPKTRGLRPLLLRQPFDGASSSDSPEDEGIKTQLLDARDQHRGSSDSPEDEGIKTVGVIVSRM